MAFPCITFWAAKKTLTPEELLEKAREAYNNYDTEQARHNYNEYTSQLTKKRKTVDEDVQAEIARVTLMENMLSRVESIVIVDSLCVDSADFIKNYRLAPEAGTLISGADLGMPAVDVAFLPQSRTEFFYSLTDSAGFSQLVTAGILDDGTVDNPLPLYDPEDEQADNDKYPFMMADGTTLYFARDGEGSLGGYDIFMTRRDDDGSYLQPQNIGMPFNSPYNDFMLAIDETTGAGWWATDRNRIPGKVTIYIYEYTDTRVNISDDDPNLVSLAKLDNVELTRGDKNVDKLKDTIAGLNKYSASLRQPVSEPFHIAVGSTSRIYTSVEEFHSPLARKAIQQAMADRDKLAQLQKRVGELREKWSKGDKSQSSAILNLEQQIADLRKRIDESINTAITDELIALPSAKESAKQNGRQRK